MIKAEYPLEKADGSIHYQTTTTEYDTSGNVIAQNDKIDADRTARTEYTYDKRGSLVMVKNCMEDGKAQYVQYVYDIMGNKVRQFTGMTSPLTIAVSEVSGEKGNFLPVGQKPEKQRKEVNPEKRERKPIPSPMQEKPTALPSVGSKRRIPLPRQSMSIMRKMNW